MITVSNIRAKNTAVHGWYEADLHDDEYGDACVGRWHFARPYEVELYSCDGGLIGHINRTIDPEAVNVLEAFVSHHSANKREADENDCTAQEEPVAGNEIEKRYTIGTRTITRHVSLLGKKPPIVTEVRGILCDGAWWADAAPGATDEDLQKCCEMMERNDRIAEEQRASMTEEEYARFLDENAAG